MINIKYNFRKKNTYIYMILFLCILLFISFLNYKIKNLETNYVEFEYYFLVDNDIMDVIDKSDILLKEDCLLINDNVIFTINDNLKDNEIILPYSISENDILIKENKLKIVNYNNKGSISRKVFENLKEQYGYKRIYLNKLGDYAKYEEVISNILYSQPSNIKDIKGMIRLFKTLFIFVNFSLIVLIIILIINIIYDNKIYFKMLKLFGYPIIIRFILIILQILFMLTIPFVVSIVISLFGRIL